MAHVREEPALRDIRLLRELRELPRPVPFLRKQPIHAFDLGPSGAFRPFGGLAFFDFVLEFGDEPALLCVPEEKDEGENREKGVEGKENSPVPDDGPLRKQFRQLPVSSRKGHRDGHHPTPVGSEHRVFSDAPVRKEPSGRAFPFRPFEPSRFEAFRPQKDLSPVMHDDPVGADEVSEDRKEVYFDDGDRDDISLRVGQRAGKERPFRGRHAPLRVQEAAPSLDGVPEVGPEGEIHSHEGWLGRRDDVPFRIEKDEKVRSHPAVQDAELQIEGNRPVRRGGK